MFENAKSKIKRAHEHVTEFEKTVNAFLQTNFYTFGIKRNLDIGQDVLQFQITQQPPDSLSLLLGDAIHNFRAALDLAYIELIERIGRKPTKWTTFRVWKNKDLLITTLSQGILQGADDILYLLADDICAYTGGNEHLTALDELDIADKHRLLIPVFAVVQIEHIDADIVAGNATIVMRNCTAAVGQGGVLNIMGTPISGEVKFQGQGQPKFGILFGNGTGLEGNPSSPCSFTFRKS